MSRKILILMGFIMLIGFLVLGSFIIPTGIFFCAVIGLYYGYKEKDWIQHSMNEVIKKLPKKIREEYRNS